MSCPEDVVQFVTDWWELSGNIITTLAALRRLKDSYPRDYLLTFCHPNEIADGAAQSRIGLIENLVFRNLFE